MRFEIDSLSFVQLVRSNQFQAKKKKMYEQIAKTRRNILKKKISKTH